MIAEAVEAFEDDRLVVDVGDRTSLAPFLQVSDREKTFTRRRVSRILTRFQCHETGDHFGGDIFKRRVQLQKNENKLFSNMEIVLNIEQITFNLTRSIFIY